MRRVQILPEATVLSIFWTLAIIGPMSDEGGNATRANKEWSNMKRTMFSWLLLVGLVGLTGCVTQHGRRPWACMGGSCAQAPENCKSCDAVRRVMRCVVRHVRRY